MNIFGVRFSMFSMLWILLIVFQSEQISLSIITFAVAVGIYFLLSIQKARLLLYTLISSIIFIHGYFLITDVSITILLLLYITIDAAFLISEKLLRIYLILNLVITLTITSVESDQMFEMMLMSVFFYFLVAAINRMSNERKEQREIYNQLLGEYRNLKRMNIAAERDARLEERTKIARDIHDSVGHRLTALIMKLEILAIQNKHTDYEALKQMAKESLEETRHAVKALHTEENEGLATVVHLIRKLEAESHILVQFTMKQGILSVPLSNEKSVVLYRVIQEALTNAMRHAASREVQITLGKSATGDISFEITNPVFNAKVFTYGFGLTNMKKRVEEIGGTLSVYQTETHFVVAGIIPSEG